MRVAVVTPTFPKNSETFILDQVTFLLDQGAHVDVVAEAAGDARAAHREARRKDVIASTHYAGPVPRTRFGRAARVLPYVVRALGRQNGEHSVAERLSEAIHDARLAVRRAPSTLLTSDYDIVHCHFGPGGLTGLALRNVGMISGRLITTYHGYDLSMLVQQRGEGLYRRLFAQGDLQLAVSGYFRDRLVRMGCPEDRVRIQHMGVDTSRFTYRRRTVAPGRPLRLLSVARLTKKKGLEYAIQALARIAGGGVPVRYEIVGGGVLREQLGRLAADAGVRELVDFRGSVPREEVVEALQRADVFVAPSVTSGDGDQEGIPVSIMEAMATGLPVLTTRHSGIPELVEDGVSGFTVPERDVEAIAERLEFLIDRPERRERMGRAGRRKIEDEFDQRKLFDNLLRIYQTLAG